MKRTILAAALAAVLALAGCLAPVPGPQPPPQPPAPAPAPAPPLMGTLELTAVDRDTGARLAGARVDVDQIAGEDDGRTDGNGFWSGQLRQGPVAYEVYAAGYAHAAGVAALVGATDAVVPVEVRLERIAPSAPWVGRLGLSAGDRCFVDEAGTCRLPVLAHFGEAFSAYVHEKTVPASLGVRNPTALQGLDDRMPGGLTVEAQLQRIKAAGYDGIRFWDTLGYYQNAWHGREVMPWAFTVCQDSRFPECDGHTEPATPGYYEKLRDFLALLQRNGLAAEHSRGDLNGQSAGRVAEHAERVAQLYDQVGWQTLALFEGVNEDWQNGDFGPSGLRRIVAPARARNALVALSCPPDSSEEPDAVRRYAEGASVFYVHGYRVGESTDRLRHQFSLAYEAAPGTPRLGWQGEPTGPGPGVTVGRVDDSEELALLAANALMSRQVWVYMSSRGVFWDGDIATQPGFAVVPKIRAALAAFAPDVMAWPTLVHGGRPEAVLQSPIGYYQPEHGVMEGPARIDQAIAPDGRVVAVVHGGRGRKPVRNVGGRTLHLSIVWADGSDLRTETRTLAPGETLDLEYRVGRLILAEPVP